MRNEKGELIKFVNGCIVKVDTKYMAKKITNSPEFYVMEKIRKELQKKEEIELKRKDTERRVESEKKRQELIEERKTAKVGDCTIMDKARVKDKIKWHNRLFD